MKLHAIDILAIMVIACTALIVGLNILPFSTYVDINDIKYEDMCVGDDLQVISGQRDVWSFGDVKGHVFAELYILDEQTIFETTIKRETDFTYQYEPDPFAFEIRWSEPVRKTGRYGVHDIVTINPLPGVYKSTNLEEFDRTFNVIDCEI